MPLLSSFIVALVVSVVWDISGLCSNKSVCVFPLYVFVWYCFFFKFFFFVINIAKGLTDRLVTFLWELNRLHTDQVLSIIWAWVFPQVHLNIRKSLLVEFFLNYWSLLSHFQLLRDFIVEFLDLVYLFSLKVNIVLYTNMKQCNFFSTLIQIMN